MLQLRSLPEPFDMYEAVTMHITHQRRRVIRTAKTGVHKNNGQKCEGDREGVNQKICVLLGHQNLNTLMHRKHSTAEYSETAIKRINTILCSLPFTWTIIFCGPARSPILWQS
jgi:hypothetical protein